MLILEALPKSPAWQTISIGPDVSIEVQLTRPSYAEFIAERAAVNAAEAARLRLNCITNWRGVFEESADGQKTELPFSRDALGGLLRQYDQSFELLLGAVRFLFEPLAGDREKKSAAPPAAATSPTPQSTVSSSSESSATSPAPLA